MCFLSSGDNRLNQRFLSTTSSVLDVEQTAMFDGANHNLHRVQNLSYNFSRLDKRSLVLDSLRHFYISMLLYF